MDRLEIVSETRFDQRLDHGAPSLRRLDRTGCSQQLVELKGLAGHELNAEHAASVFDHLHHLFAEVIPMLTWSSRLAELGMESTLAGWHKTLFSLMSAAAVAWVIRPELSPGCGEKGGKPLSDGLTSCSICAPQCSPAQRWRSRVIKR